MPDELTSVCGIRDFIGFLEKCLRKKVVAYSWKSLTNPGENFGSELQSLEVKVTETYGSQVKCILISIKECFNLLFEIVKLCFFIQTDWNIALGGENTCRGAVYDRSIPTIVYFCKRNPLLLRRHTSFGIFSKNFKHARARKNRYIHCVCWFQNFTQSKYDAF